MEGDGDDEGESGNEEDLKAKKVDSDDQGIKEEGESLTESQNQELKVILTKVAAKGEDTTYKG